jgi:hypothetical protein
MAKVLSSDKLMSGVERLLVGLVREASIGDVKNPDGTLVTEGPSFAEKLKLASTASSFLATRAKIIADEPDEPSEFEGVLNELRGKAVGNPDPTQKTRGRKRSEHPTGSDGTNVHPIPLRDPLAPAGSDPYTINGHVYANGQNGADGGALNSV